MKAIFIADALQIVFGVIKLGVFVRKNAKHPSERSTS